MKYEILDEDYFNNTSRLYQFYFHNGPSKFLLLNEKNNHLLKNFVFNKQTIKLSKNKDEDFTLIGTVLNEDFEEGKRINNIELCQNLFLNKFLLLLTEGQLIITSNIEAILSENTIVLGVFIEDNLEENLLVNNSFSLVNIKQLIIPNSICDFLKSFEEPNYLNAVEFEEVDIDAKEVNNNFDKNNEHEEYKQEEDEEEEVNFDEGTSLLNEEFDDEVDKDNREKERLDPIEERLNKIKNKKRCERMTEDHIRDEVEKFKANLREANLLDKQQMKHKLPAMNKLRLLGSIEKFLSNKYFQTEFLRGPENEGCRILEEWIKKNPDGTYPPINQLSKMIDILSLLKIDIDNLKECNIGKHVMDISKNFKNNKTVSKKAKELCEKWLRQIYGINNDYRDYLNEHENTSERVISRKREKTSNLEAELKSHDQSITKPSLDEEGDNGKKETNIFTHARIPKKGLFDFTKRPIPMVSKEALKSNSNKIINYGKILQKKKEFTNSSKKVYDLD